LPNAVGLPQPNPRFASGTWLTPHLNSRCFLKSLESHLNHRSNLTFSSQQLPLSRAIFE